MKHFTRLFILALVGAWSTQNADAQLIINELMQSNIDCVMDDLNEFPDSWVEIYNPGDDAVNLQGWKLGESDNPDMAWSLPAMQVGPRQLMLIYCDKEANGRHTDFRLESGKGCEVYLFNGRQVADQVKGLKKQPAPNISYGRKSEGSNEWGYQYIPTPAQKNCGTLAENILGAVEFSQKGRVMTTSQMLKVELKLPAGAPAESEIRYTRDGSEPTQGSLLYNGTPISVTANTIIRAKAFCNGWLSPRSTVHSYIYFPNNRKLTLPVVSIVTDKRYFYDPKIGIYYKNNNKNADDRSQNYFNDWRRPVNFEYFEGDDTESLLNQLCETRIQGGATRTNMRKSLAMYANKRFGEKRLEYEFFPDQRPGITDFKSIVLRNSGNDFDYLYLRDAIIQRNMALHTDLDWQAWRPVIVYINGEYTGILNIRERANEDNIYTNYNKLEDIDLIENWWDLKEGDWDNYNRFREFYNEHGHTMAEYEKWMDCQEFINLMVMNLYYCNLDFPGNNIVMWRPRTDEGRWRWIAKDTDFGLGLYNRDVNYNTVQWINNHDHDPANNWANDWEHTRLFRRLMEDTDFKREFLDRAAIYMGDFMNYRGTHEVWDPMYEQIRIEYPYHRELINRWWPNYSDEVNMINNWLSKRTDIFYRQLADFYQQKQPVVLTINKGMSPDEQAAIGLEFNDVKLSSGLFDGKFYPDHTIRLKGTAPEGKVISGWTINQVNGSNGLQSSTVEGATLSMTMPSCTSLSIKAMLADATGIEQPTTNGDWQWRSSGDQLVLSGVAGGTHVMLYNLQGMLLTERKADGGDVLIALPHEARGQILVLKVGADTRRIKF